MRNTKQRMTKYIMIGLGVGICVLPFTFGFGWWLSNYFYPKTKEVESLPIEIDLATTKITETEAEIYGELILICTGSSNTILIQPDGKYFDAPDYCGMWSPDGRYMVKSDDNVVSGPGVLYRERGSLDLINITENLPVPGWISFFSWSPEGKYVSIAGWDHDETKNGVYLIDMTSDMPPQEVEFLFHTDETHGLGLPTWSPNGMFIGISVGNSPGSPYILSLDGTIVWEAPKDIYPLGDAISWSPDSTKFVYTAFTEEATADNYDTQLVIAELRNRRVSPLNFDRRASFPSWSPDGKWILFHLSDEDGYGDNLYASRPDGTNLTSLGDPGRSWTIGGWSLDKKSFLLAENILSLNLEQKKPDPFADSYRYYMVDLDSFEKELFFQNDSFTPMPLSVYPLMWLPATKDIGP